MAKQYLDLDGLGLRAIKDEKGYIKIRFDKDNIAGVPKNSALYEKLSHYFEKANEK
ncbi:hypothetical protein [Halobacillus ihumii]|uniref:hypothetical protein n=1 Tax=Halobacillus ihumii TaxID=2686092 RepID=UPI0013D64869|nr:hypothetical protein [Halobacillus ihumii]